MSESCSDQIRVISESYPIRRPSRACVWPGCGCAYSRVHTRARARARAYTQARTHKGAQAGVHFEMLALEVHSAVCVWPYAEGEICVWPYAEHVRLMHTRPYECGRMHAVVCMRMYIRPYAEHVRLSLPPSAADSSLAPRPRRPPSTRSSRPPSYRRRRCHH